MSFNDLILERITAERLAQAMQGDVHLKPSPSRVAEAQGIINHLGYLYRLRADAGTKLTSEDGIKQLTSSRFDHTTKGGIG